MRLHRLSRPERPLRFTNVVTLLLLGILSFAHVRTTHAQSYGIELHNSLMPASGGMAGTSIARPQDLQSALNGNPAALTQFRGTQFGFGGAWVEPTYKIDQNTALPGVGVTPYEDKSGTPGSVLGNIGVTQDISALGLPATVGLGFLGNAGAGVDFRDVAASNGTSAHYIALDVVAAGGAQVTDRLSIGASFILGVSFLDGPFVDVGGMVPDYGIRGSLGANYDVGCDTTVGGYWQSRKRFTFDDAAFIGADPPRDINFDHPTNFGFGIANESLCGGCLLIAADAIYKVHSEADFLKSLYNDQWAFTVGAQYTVNPRVKLRVGYGYNENPMLDAQVSSIGGVPVADGVPGIRYIQGQFASVSQHRLTVGVGVQDLLPGLDFDLFGGGMLENSDQFSSTIASLEGYWLGGGFTWRFGRGSCEPQCIPNEWGSSCGCESDCGCY